MGGRACGERGADFLSFSLAYRFVLTYCEDCAYNTEINRGFFTKVHDGEPGDPIRALLLGRDMSPQPEEKQNYPIVYEDEYKNVNPQKEGI